MNPYPARIAELHAFLADRYGQRDTQATDIVLTAMLDQTATGYTRPSIIIESDWPLRDTADAWFSFGIEPEPVKALAAARTLRPRNSEALIQHWIDTQCIRLYVDAEWRRMPTIHPKARAYKTLLSRCVRLRVDHPKGEHGTRTLDEQARDRAELARLAGRVLDSGFRRITGTVDHSHIPASFGYWCELLQYLAPLQYNWEALTSGFASVARLIPALYNDDRPADWIAAERLMRDTIPYTIRWILEHIGAERVESKKAWDIYCESGQVHGAEERKIVSEIRRMALVGILTPLKTGGFRGIVRDKDPYRNRPWRYMFKALDYKRLVDRNERILQ